MKRINVTPLAFESFGVRSMCAYIETPDLKLLIDPGVSLGPRFALLPHPREYAARAECRKRVAEAAEKVEIVTISHWHYDHHTPNYLDTVWNGSSPEIAQQIYQDKIILAKDIRSNINFSQRRRGWVFQKASKKFVRKIEVADGKSFQFGETQLKFSSPVFHGEEDSALGWVLMLTVEYGEEKVMHASDIQGPISNAPLNFILREKPDLLIIGGPPLYLAGFKASEEKILHGLKNLVRIAQNVPMVILEHHLLRAEDWRTFSAPVFEAAKKAKHDVLTAAELLGKENNLLEFKRRKLYEIEPPNQAFLKWMKLPRTRRGRVTPPL